ncbi:hypothetical protein BIW11_09495 [Tropilaelaps mercedesae]|uniref:CLIP domain-containing serine protease n=1 Tax=Tropilaelaps mercedesae TaxID=418985 RepID=A0A1V9XKC1_9ACAR|nr:hypothetical protein BIW11_09495 [Tropilaelaps mercedesae]
MWSSSDTVRIFKNVLLWSAVLPALVLSQLAQAADTAAPKSDVKNASADVAISVASGGANDTNGDFEERFALPGPVVFPEDDPDSCVSPEDRSGLCVEIKYCRSLRRVGLNSLRKYICGFHGNTPLLCCAGLQKSYPKPDPGSWPSSQPQSYPQLKPQPQPQPQLQPGLSSNDFRPPKPSFLPEQCGIGALQANRIVGGREATPGSYPWIIAVFVDFNNQKIHICGATLVSHRHIVSAAHCFFDGKNPGYISPCALRRFRLPYNIYRMRLGDHDITREDEVTGTLELPILGYKTHPGYVQKTYLNDISMSYLAEDVPFSKAIGPACLPYTGFEQDLTRARAIVAGWGYTKYQSGKSNPILKETDIPIWSMEECAKAFKNELNITEDYLCAGDGEGKTDSCQGDSGGPLIMWGDDGRYYLMGVVSFGKRCATPGYPGAYTRITKQLKWLNSNF